MIRGKRILIGVTGGIAAYKTAWLVRLFIKAGAEVRVVMTPSAMEFVTPVTLSALSKNPVVTEFSDKISGAWNNHVDLGLWADAFIIAPATANTIASMAEGKCDNVLLAVYLSARCPVFLAPAMDLDMYKHPSTQQNLQVLRKNGNHIIDPAAGELASGLSGEGRMQEPEDIFAYIENYFNANMPLKGKRVLVTAGPTYEAIDAVRFIGNRSSGKMGYAVADAFADQGADVTLVSGPSHVQCENRSVNLIRIESASEMHAECMKVFGDADIIVMAAAVADYKPEQAATGKIKKDSASLNITLVGTKDILSEMGKAKKKTQLLAGFALETDNELENAKSKLQKKNLDFIFLNSLNDAGAGFNTDTNLLTIITPDGKVSQTALKPKREIAKEIVNLLSSKFNSQY